MTGGPDARLGAIGRAVVGGLTAYQRWISPALPPACRYWPTCAEYALVAIIRQGLGRGSVQAAGRLLRCHPLSPGGIDPPKGYAGPAG